MKRDPMLLDWKNQYLEHGCAPQSSLQMQSTNGVFHTLSLKAQEHLASQDALTPNSGTAHLKQ